MSLNKHCSVPEEQEYRPEKAVIEWLFRIALDNLDTAFRMLGHKTLKSTMIYIDLEKAIYGSPRDEEFTVRVATTLKEACSLVEAGFEYVTEIDGGKIFRKRK